MELVKDEEQIIDTFSSIKNQLQGFIWRRRFKVYFFTNDQVGNPFMTCLLDKILVECQGERVSGRLRARQELRNSQTNERMCGGASNHGTFNWHIKLEDKEDLPNGAYGTYNLQGVTGEAHIASDTTVNDVFNCYQTWASQNLGKGQPCLLINDIDFQLLYVFPSHISGLTWDRSVTHKGGTIHDHNTVISEIPGFKSNDIMSFNVKQTTCICGCTIL